ncbi:S1 domain-containing post-transcriptional regulator GSP13 [Bacillus kwashiorkori]|uniref:S1 domain-containing post-transcriptional regulator GSP13 n=1 Tax=Bacillus kwashiorkori TaxID=1522318 RepID=UPI000784F177|nr:S1 domain-containing post-transcriptional regulator GSP13 [Bacillus kwashiorkori]
MSDKIEVGMVVKGLVTGIQPYGAFIALSDNKQGLIHISEITNGYVKNIHDFIKVGEEITVKVLAVDEAEGKISLSLKALNNQSSVSERERNKSKLDSLTDSSNQGFNTLKEKLSEWIEQSKKEGLINK